MKKKVILFTLLVAMSAGMPFAQMGQVGSIRGTVLIQEEGVPLPGVSVTLRSPSLVLPSMSAMTNEKGQYRFVNLSPGVYELTFEIEGFAKVIRKGIIVSANMTFTVDLSMSPERIEETITVVGDAPTIDRLSTAKTTTLDSTFLKSVPAGRNLNYLLRMTPGVTGTSSEGASSQGATVRDNLYSMDGIEVNDPSVGTVPGNPMSMEIMEEISIQTGGVSAEWGSAKGSIVNIVTKSGGNRFSGDIQFLYEHENLRSDNTAGTPFEGLESGNKFWLEPSFSLGGPVAKDKLWFFTNFTYRGSDRFIPGFPHDGDPIPVRDKSYNPYLKLTFQPSETDKVVVGLSYQRRDHNPYTGSKWDNIDTVNKVLRVTTIPSFHWIHMWGSNFITNFKVGLLSYKWDFLPTENGANPYYWEWSTGLGTNGIGFEDLYQRTRIQVNADGTLFIDDFAGSHEIKFGIQNSFHFTRRTANVFGPKDSGGLTQLFRYDYYGEPYEAEWAAGFVQKKRSMNSGAFLQDAWSISPRLTLNLGVRLDYNWNYTPKQNGAVGGFPAVGSLAYMGDPDSTWDLDIEENVTHFKWWTFSPRLGVIFDVFGDGSTLIKTNFSQYLQANYTATTWFVSPVGWVWVYGATNPDGTLAEIYGAWVPGSTMQMGYKDHELVAPRTYELNIGVERELWEDVSISGRFIRRWDRRLIEDADGASLDMDALMNDGELVWNTDRWKEVSYVDPYDGSTATFYESQYWATQEGYLVNPPGLKRDYTAFEFSIRKRFSRGWSFDLSYVYSKSTGLVQNTYWASELDEPLYNNPNAHRNALGDMGLRRPHQIKLSGVVKGPFGINISGYARFLSGRSQPRRLSAWSSGLGFSAYIIAEPFGNYHLPDQYLLDFRLEKEFRIGDSLTLKAFADGFNITNTNKAVLFETYSDSAYREFQEMTSIMGPRVFRIGAKIEFDL